MFYLEACEICQRHGSVAEKPDDTICKNCKDTKEIKKAKVKIEYNDEI